MRTIERVRALGSLRGEDTTSPPIGVVLGRIELFRAEMIVSSFGFAGVESQPSVKMLVMTLKGNVNIQ